MEEATETHWGFMSNGSIIIEKKEEIKNVSNVLLTGSIPSPIHSFRGITWLSVMRIFYEICCELHKLKYRNYETARFKPYGNILRA